MNNLVATETDKRPTGVDRLFGDQTYHFQAMRVLSDTAVGAADINEVLQTIATIPEGDESAWYEAFAQTARNCEALAESCQDRISKGLALKRAHTYWRTAEFLLSPSDPRRDIAWERQISDFNAGLTELGVDFERFSVPYETGHINAIYYPAPGGQDKPLIVVVGGYDSSLEELYFFIGKDANERGYDVLTYEGPGQGAMLREQQIYFTHEWEKPTSALLDHFTANFPRHDKMVLLGISLGGYLAPRAAAYDPRIDGVIAFDVLFDCGEIVEPFRALAAHPVARDIPGVKWMLANGLWVFGKQDVASFVDTTKLYALADVSDRITGDVLILAGEVDHFVPVAQADAFADALVNARSVEKVVYSKQSGGGEHCQLGAMSLWQATVFDWLVRRFG